MDANEELYNSNSRPSSVMSNRVAKLANLYEDIAETNKSKNRVSVLVQCVLCYFNTLSINCPLAFHENIFRLDR